MPAGRPSLYKPEYCEKIVELASEGKGWAEIAHTLGVTRTTLYEWGDKHPDFSTALTRAKVAEQAWWEDTGRKSLFADKFQAAVWSKSMSARFRDDYTERTKAEITGKDGEPFGGEVSPRDLAKALLAELTKPSKE